MKRRREFRDSAGTGENDMTAALGLVLSRSPRLLEAFLDAVAGSGIRPSANATVHLQTGETDGITDLEIHDVGLHVIVEAKRGPILPSDGQLRKYAPRLAASKAVTKRLVTLSQAPTTAEGKRTLDGFQINHVTWRQVRDLGIVARTGEKPFAARLLKEFGTYLEGIIRMDVSRSNMVYVVSLAKGRDDDWGLPWIEFVEQRRLYFYPVSKGWPEPPNYIAFRYDGKLQSLHHVEQHEVITRPRQVCNEGKSTDKGRHYLLHLGPPIRPAHEVRTGPGIKRSARVWCAIDTLLTAATITDALAATKAREHGR